MSRAASVCAVFAAVLGLTACKSAASTAKEQFSRDFSCPEERVEVRDRSDIRASAFGAPTPTPPPDVAADPARRALWEKKNEPDTSGIDSDYSVEEARGCDKQSFYLCIWRAAGRAQSCSNCICEDPTAGHYTLVIVGGVVEAVRDQADAVLSVNTAVRAGAGTTDIVPRRETSEAGRPIPIPRVPRRRLDPSAAAAGHRVPAGREPGAPRTPRHRTPALHGRRAQAPGREG